MEEKKFVLTPADKEEIENAIKYAENETSGEIRVHIEPTLEDEDLMDRASRLFAAMKMHNTKHRNGVLFYLAFEDRKFAILGDKGIHSQVKDDFWHDIKETMQQYFQDGRFCDGLAKGIELAGDALKEKFPKQADDVNELPDEISYKS